MLASAGAAHAMSVSAFGAYALAFSIYVLVVGLSRATSSEALLAGTAGCDSSELELKLSTGAALLIGSTIALAMSLVALMVSNTLRLPLLALAATLPGLVVQDSVRLGFIATGEPKRAALNDLLWGILTAVGLGALFVGSVHAPALFILFWGLAGGVAALSGLLRIRTMPAVLAASGWIWGIKRFVGTYQAEFFTKQGSTQLTIYAITALVGLDAIAALRAGQLLLGPLTVFVAGISLMLLPEARRALAAGVDEQRMFKRRFTLLLALAPMVWVGGLELMPESVGVTLLGESFDAAQRVLIPLGLAVSATGAAAASFAIVRVARENRLSFFVRCMTSAVIAGAGIWGAVSFGLTGAVYGLAAGSCISAVAWYYTASYVIRRNRSVGKRTPQAPATVPSEAIVTAPTAD